MSQVCSQGRHVGLCKAGGKGGVGVGVEDTNGGDMEVFWGKGGKLVGGGLAKLGVSAHFSCCLLPLEGEDNGKLSA